MTIIKEEKKAEKHGIDVTTNNMFSLQKKGKRNRDAGKTKLEKKNTHRKQILNLYIKQIRTSGP